MVPRLLSRRAFASGLATSGIAVFTSALPQPARASTHDTLQACVEREFAAGFRGVALVDRGDERFAWATPGFAADETRFWIASISKAVTATLAVRLAQRNALALSVRVHDLFAWSEGALAATSLERLLSHRAGLGMHYAADGIADRDAAVRAILARGVEKDGFYYSNDGYSLVAAMLEQATGTAFETLLRSEIFSPAGMASAGVWGEPLDVSRFAPFPANGGGRMTQLGKPVRNYGQLGASGLFATGSDMMSFLRVMHDPAFLSADARALLWTPGWSRTPGAEPRSGTSYGRGWALNVRDDIVVNAYHGGNEDWLRHNGQIKTWPARNLRIVVLSNSGDVGDVSWSQHMLTAMERDLDVAALP